MNTSIAVDVFVFGLHGHLVRNILCFLCLLVAFFLLWLIFMFGGLLCTLLTSVSMLFEYFLYFSCKNPLSLFINEANFEALQVNIIAFSIFEKLINKWTFFLSNWFLVRAQGSSSFIGFVAYLVGLFNLLYIRSRLISNRVKWVFEWFFSQ